MKAEDLACYRANWGLTTMSPREAHNFWFGKGQPAAGLATLAVAALCDEVERLREAIAKARAALVCCPRRVDLALAALDEEVANV